MPTAQSNYPIAPAHRRPAAATGPTMILQANYEQIPLKDYAESASLDYSI